MVPLPFTIAMHYSKIRTGSELKYIHLAEKRLTCRPVIFCVYLCHRVILNPEFLDRKPTPVLVLSFFAPLGSNLVVTLISILDCQGGGLNKTFSPQLKPIKPWRNRSCLPPPSNQTVCWYCTLKKEKAFFTHHHTNQDSGAVSWGVIGSFLFLFDHLFPLHPWLGEHTNIPTARPQKAKSVCPFLEFPASSPIKNGY